MPDPLGGFDYTWPLYAAALLGYLLGSIPFGLVLTRLAGAGDIRAIGSGNIGATNVLRTGRKGLALATLLLDGAKGAVAVLIANQFFGQDMAVMAGGGAFLGHLFPVWLRFQGGKGVATFLGIQLAIAWPVGVLACLTWLLTALVFRFSSLAALVAAIMAPVYCYGLATISPWQGLVLADFQRAEFAAILALLVVIRHRANIARLLRGEEPRIG
ncbi:glycerol-3-phosphate 1-O-acyltransferase PlsY [Oceanibacterium hippocampi]|uniref:Glycerol-3-phosphate acyltransferase n=1 Tax=Oceanibacterium hippocampi TaxID=745714 RepID=A0A1Y5SSE7_9PROT|nr:glycerol-3-phosphate 1-O-acyltransferase PlsY [Oceanibacterium hippocampi]SLN44190.1 putative glycerol-3-phosphate acyltransferase [Oceanibacterium hippocampi]